MACRHVARCILTREDYEQIKALAEKGETGTFDTSRPITVIPTWILGPEPGDKDFDEAKSIEVMMKYRTAQGETGTMQLTFWTPTSAVSNQRLRAPRSSDFAGAD